MANVESIADETAVVLGAALYVGHFPKEFHRFVTRFQRELGNVRPWIFVLGPTENEPKHFSQAEEQARKELAKYPWLHAADVRVMGGRFRSRPFEAAVSAQPGDEAAGQSDEEAAGVGYSGLGIYSQVGAGIAEHVKMGGPAAGRVCGI